MGIAGGAITRTGSGWALTRHRRARWRIALVAAAVALSLVAAGCAPDVAPADRIAEIISFVERVRGRQFLTTPVVTFESDANFRADVLASVEAAKPAIDDDEVAFKALGWMAPADSLYAKYQVAFGRGVVGYYDPASKVLKVRGTNMTPYRREVIAHELTHALDDQHFDLDVEKGPGLISQEQLAFLVAVEGDAVRVQQSYVATLNPLEKAQSLGEQLSLGSDPALLTVPLALLSLAQMPYLQGPRFTRAQAAAGVPAGLDAVFDRYPDTEEEAFDPAKYASDEGSVTLPTPPADGTVVRSGTWGQFLLTLILQEGVSLDATVNRSTNGWAGGAFVTWRNGGDDCIRIDTRMDTATQAHNLATALGAWAVERPAATVSDNGTDVRLTSCN